MTAQIIDRFPLILGFASMKARGICLKMFLHPFFGKKLENVNYSVTCEAITKDCWNGNPNRPFPRPGHCKKGLLAGWPLGIGLSEKWVPQNRWKTSFSGHDLAGKKKMDEPGFGKFLANMCASFYTISNSECKLSRTPQLGMFLFSEFTTENIAA